MCVNFRSDRVIAKIELFSVELAPNVQTVAKKSQVRNIGTYDYRVFALHSIM